MKRKNKKMSAITISKKQIDDQRGVVVLPIEEYQRLVLEASAVPVEHVSPKEVARLDKMAKKALRDYKNGKLKKLTSLADLR